VMSVSWAGGTCAPAKTLVEVCEPSYYVALQLETALSTQTVCMLRLAAPQHALQDAHCCKGARTSWTCQAHTLLTTQLHTTRVSASHSAPLGHACCSASTTCAASTTISATTHRHRRAPRHSTCKGLRRQYERQVAQHLAADGAPSTPDSCRPPWGLSRDACHQAGEIHLRPPGGLWERPCCALPPGQPSEFQIASTRQANCQNSKYTRNPKPSVISSTWLQADTGKRGKRGMTSCKRKSKSRCAATLPVNTSIVCGEPSRS
jgi:hypothetical protein